MPRASKHSRTTPIQNLRLSQARERSSYALNRRLDELFSKQTEFLYGNLIVSNRLTPGIWNNIGVYTIFFRNLLAGSNTVDTVEKFNNLLLSLLQFLTNDMHITIENYTRQSIGNLQVIVNNYASVKFADDPLSEYNPIISEYKEIVELIKRSLEAFANNSITNLILSFDTMMYTFLIAKIHSKLTQTSGLSVLLPMVSQAARAVQSRRAVVSQAARAGSLGPMSQYAQSGVGGVFSQPLFSINASGLGTSSYGPTGPYASVGGHGFTNRFASYPVERGGFGAGVPGTSPMQTMQSVQPTRRYRSI